MKQLRRTMLFAPASNPKMLFNVQVYRPDCIIFDLEDAVKYEEKSSARDLLVEALKAVDFEKCEVFARINPLRTPHGKKGEFGEKDVRELVPAGLTRIRLPMCETKEHIVELSALLDEVEKKHDMKKNTVKIQASLETPLGVLNALEIANASDRVISISFGAEDFTSSLGVDRTKTGTELLYARSQVVLAASVAKIDAIDTVWSDLSDPEGFKKEVELIRGLGFAGKSCIHPSQIKSVHAAYTPTQDAVSKALEIVNASEKANIQAGGAITVNGRMIDIPIIEKAKRIISLSKEVSKY
jgi:citrate lyase subunit beta / citryl-CoA lyase